MTELDKALERVRTAKQELARCNRNEQAAVDAVTRATDALNKAEELQRTAHKEHADAMLALQNIRADPNIEADDPGTIPARIRPDAVEKQEDEADDGAAEAKASDAFKSLQERLQS